MLFSLSIRILTIYSLPTGPTWSLEQYRLNACDVNKQRVVIRTNTDANVCVCVYLNIKYAIKLHDAIV